jgi:hypothetical protein
MAYRVTHRGVQRGDAWRIRSAKWRAAGGGWRHEGGRMRQRGHHVSHGYVTLAASVVGCGVSRVHRCATICEPVGHHTPRKEHDVACRGVSIHHGWHCPWLFGRLGCRSLSHPREDDTPRHATGCRVIRHPMRHAGVSMGHAGGGGRLDETTNAPCEAWLCDTSRHAIRQRRFALRQGERREGSVHAT